MAATKINDYAESAYERLNTIPAILEFARWCWEKANELPEIYKNTRSIEWYFAQHLCSIEASHILEDVKFHFGYLVNDTVYYLQKDEIEVKISEILAKVTA